MTAYQDIVFPDPLIFEALGGTPTGKSDGSLHPWNLYQLVHEFRVIWRDGVIAAPALFINDRASIPQIGRSFIPKDGPWQPGAIIHDWVGKNKGVPGCETFALANDLFFECMKAKGTSRVERNIIFGAVSSDIGRAIWDDDE